MGLRTAILHQGAPVPAIGGVAKPFKPGGYTDSGSDLACGLRSRNVPVVTPTQNPDPSQDQGFTYPDTVEGIQAAVSDGAQVLWANTVLHSKHALVQLRPFLAEKGVRMVGQSPAMTEEVDDKAVTNSWLSKQTGLGNTFPEARLIKSVADGYKGGKRMVKPIRGRGSYGVTLVQNEKEWKEAVERLLKESAVLLEEEFCGGEEVTVAIMPPGKYSAPIGIKDRHWAMPVVQRVGHHDGVAPYSGKVAVSANSRVLTTAEHSDPTYGTLQRKCERVAELLGTVAPMRMDARRREGGGEFVLFDVNMKPNITGPGRPGREEHAALTAMAAEEFGWDYAQFIEEILNQAQLVEKVIPAEEQPRTIVA